MLRSLHWKQLSKTKGNLRLKCEVIPEHSNMVPVRRVNHVRMVQLLQLCKRIEGTLACRSSFSFSIIILSWYPDLPMSCLVWGSFSTQPSPAGLAHQTFGPWLPFHTNMSLSSFPWITHSITFILNLVFWTVLSLFLLSTNSCNKWNLKPSTSETEFKASCLLHIVFYLSIQVPNWLSHLHQFKDLFVFILCITSYLHPPI